MLRWLLAQPLFVLVMGMAAFSMIVPAIHASVVSDDHTARAFFYFSILFVVLVAMVAIAMTGQTVRRRGRSHLIALLATFTLLPVMLAVPFHEAVRTTTFTNAYFEMVSSLTTTGATLFAPDRLPDSVHLWRAEVAWLGGFFIWVMAAAVLAPMNLGGYEVRSTVDVPGAGAVHSSMRVGSVAPTERLTRVTLVLFPVYAGLTVALWAILFLLGDKPLVALIHAMSTLSTSAISPVAEQPGDVSGFAGEVAIFLFLFFALSRMTFSRFERTRGQSSLYYDPELRLGCAIVLGVVSFLILRHWLGALEVRSEANAVAFFKTLWGAAFTVLSFLTTTGFESVYWADAQNWSGLRTPGLILMGLALMGGGVATTAGGVKLLRVQALYLHGIREMDKLVHPNSVGSSGRAGRSIRREGAYLAWIFFMLFVLSIAVVMSALSLAGLGFEEALILSIASLTTTGPLASVAASEPIDLLSISELARGICAAAMIVGRLETLAIIALLNPDFWRG